jgi:hypothetical protein
MLRDIDSGELGKLFSRGMEDNMDKRGVFQAGAGRAAHEPDLLGPQEAGGGRRVQIDWIPGTGTVITVKGVVQGEPFKEPEFFNALLRIWLGRTPPTGSSRTRCWVNRPDHASSTSESTNPSASTARTGSPWL